MMGYSKVVSECLVSVVILILSVCGKNTTTIHVAPYGPKMCQERCNNSMEVCLFQLEHLKCVRVVTWTQPVTTSSKYQINQTQLTECNKTIQETNTTGTVGPNPTICLFVKFPPGTNYTRCLIDACMEGRLCLVKNIVSMGLVRVTDDWMGDTPISTAITNGREQVASFLFRFTGDRSWRKKDNRTLLFLHKAARRGQMDMARTLVLEEGFDIDSRDRDGYTPLLQAAEGGHVDLLRWLVCMGSNVSAESNSKSNVLISASNQNNSEAVKFILSLKAVDVDHKQADGTTALMAAVLGGCLDNVKLLIEHGANLTIRSVKNNTILHFACRSGTVMMVSYVLGLNVFDIDCSGFRGMAPLHYASAVGFIDGFEYLRKMGSKLIATDNDDNNALHIACIRGQLPIVKHIIEHGYIGIETRGMRDYTPVLYTAAMGSVKIMKYLESQYCNLKVRDEDGNTVLHIAAINENAGIIQYLLPGKKIQPEAKNRYGNTALLEAVHHSDVKIVDTLYKHGCNLSAVNTANYNSLHLAVKLNNSKMIRYLLKSGRIDLDSSGGKTGRNPLLLAAIRGNVESLIPLIPEKYIEQTDNDGNNILHMACLYGNMKSTRYIITHYKSLIDSVTLNGNTPVLLAAEKGHISIVKYLIQMDCDVLVRNDKLETLMHMACRRGSLDLVKFLTSRTNIAIMSKNKDGMTPVELAFSKGHVKIAKYLNLNRPNVPMWEHTI